MQKRVQVVLLVAICESLGSTAAWTLVATEQLAEQPAEQRDAVATVGGGEFTLQGAIARSSAPASGERVRGGALTLSGTVLNVIAEDASRAGSFGLTASTQRSTGAGSDCLCNLLFADGFETGDTTRWSSGSP